METLDAAYLNDIVIRAARGSSNAFAELYSATWPLECAYALRCLEEFGADSPDLAVREAVKETYVEALRTMSKLQHPGLFLPWLSQIMVKSCARIAGRGDFAEDTFRVEKSTRIVGQIMTLPVIESQVLVMQDYQKMPPKEIGGILNLGTGAVKRYRRMALKHLKMLDF